MNFEGSQTPWNNFLLIILEWQIELTSHTSCFIFFGPSYNYLWIFEVEMTKGCRRGMFNFGIIIETFNMYPCVKGHS